ncbi:uncharacterized protein METZ01_LOCUS469373 [marine metagenome]|uniref:Uncharacterized protein n=1 Tax=marine metagenome TaxID=408172 RepID=A0A383B9T6_9ZZZZ
MYYLLKLISFDVAECGEVLRSG